MDLSPAVAGVLDAVSAREPVVPVGAATQWEVGGPPPEARPVRTPAGIVALEPADLTVTVGAGTPVAAVETALAPHGQEIGLDPRDPAATVGGVLAAGLSGPRRARLGPVRDAVLGVRFVTGDGRLVTGGGRTVKNVSGYDLPRLLVGSLGTLGVLVEVTLRARPRPPCTRWFRGTGPDGVLRTVPRASSRLWDGRTVAVLLEAHADDVAAQAAAGDLRPADGPPAWPTGPHRGRIALAPERVTEAGAALDRTGARWLAELGVGTIHVAADEPAALAAARGVAHAHGGWMLREAGAPGLDGWGTAIPVGEIHARLRRAFDPDGILAPGRVPW